MLNAAFHNVDTADWLPSRRQLNTVCILYQKHALTRYLVVDTVLRST